MFQQCWLECFTGCEPHGLLMDDAAFNLLISHTQPLH